MDFPSIIDPEQLTILAKTFDDYCFVCGITDDPSKEAIASLIVMLFQNGLRTAEELKAALQMDPSARARRAKLQS